MTDPLALPEKPEPAPTWTWRDVVVVGLFAAVAQGLVVAGAWLIVLLAGEGGGGWMPAAQSLTRNPWFVLPVQLVWWVLVFWVVYRVVRARDSRPFRAAIGWVRPARPVSVYLAGGILLALSVGGLARLLPLPRGGLPMEELFTGPGSAYLLAAFGTLFAPAIEELLFRGFLYPVVERSHGAVVAILSTALFFAVLHAPQYGFAWQNLLLLSYVGSIFGAVRGLSGTLVAPTLVHAAYNFTLFAGLYVSTNRFQDL